MNTKKYVLGSEEDKILLRDFLRTCIDSKAHHRAQAILWSMEGRSRTDLSQLFDVKADTISNWFKRWHPKDLTTLNDIPRSGRPPTLDADKKKVF